MKRVATMLLLGGCLGASLGACSQPEPVQNVQWQVTNVYTTPEYPSEVPDSVAGAVTLTFGASSLTGSTGCARLQAVVDYDTKDPSEAKEMTVREIVFDPIDEQQCTGHARFIHDHMVDILHDGRFDIRPEPNSSAKVLLKQSDQFQRPGLRIATV
ncbi:hypothetical protein [Corynebacterium pelargi]|uniref:Uncharacterized protein n=1 Tax=Corynebacterium pelargi TaxID=1471400 RepID=A0A410W6U9_9CORY|nr:hypothetical protein [Corynebacterium pelargi]QAU51670.1 hypothetical protein CPELA_01855 [Corynebacterium pelargi]GGG80385.1 hypothetical protein GCM10007338_18620 [Corynebacterium pelargi]